MRAYIVFQWWEPGQSTHHGVYQDQERALKVAMNMAITRYGHDLEDHGEVDKWSFTNHEGTWGVCIEETHVSFAS